MVDRALSATAEYQYVCPVAVELKSSRPQHRPFRLPGPACTCAEVRETSFGRGRLSGVLRLLRDSCATFSCSDHFEGISASTCGSRAASACGS